MDNALILRLGGFDHDDNAVCVYTPDGQQSFPTTAKTELARDLIEVIAGRYEQLRGSGTQPRLTVVSVQEK